MRMMCRIPKSRRSIAWTWRRRKKTMMMKMKMKWRRRKKNMMMVMKSSVGGDKEVFD